MAECSSADTTRKATGILGQLQKYVQQLATSEEDPSVDIMALSNACGERFEDLKAVLPRAVEIDRAQSTGNPTAVESDMVRKIADLQNELQSCIKVLERGRNSAARELKEFMKARKAIKAYRD